MAKFSLSTLLKWFLKCCIHVTVLIIKKEIFNRLFVNVSSLLILIEWVLGVEFFVKIWRKKIAKNMNCHLLSSLINFIKVWERLFLHRALLSIIGIQMKSYDPPSPTNRKQCFPYLSLILKFMVQSTIGKSSKIKFDNSPVFYSIVPLSDQSIKQTWFHLYKRTEKINNYKLSVWEIYKFKN